MGQEVGQVGGGHTHEQDRGPVEGGAGPDTASFSQQHGHEARGQQRQPGRVAETEPVRFQVAGIGPGDAGEAKGRPIAAVEAWNVDGLHGTGIRLLRSFWSDRGGAGNTLAMIIR